MRRIPRLLAPLLTAACMGARADSVPPTTPPVEEELSEIVVVAPEPRYVAPTTRDRIGRVWVPVHLDGQGPFRLVLDTGALRSAVTEPVARQLGRSLDESPPVRVRGVTGTAITPTITIGELHVGDLWLGPSRMPVLEDAFGGAEGLLGVDGMQQHRIYIDFRHDFIHIARSQNRRAAAGFLAVPFLRDAGALLAVEATVGGVATRAIIDTGAQATVGNEALRQALRRQVQRNIVGPDQVYGATGDMQIGIGARVSPIRIGGLEVRDAHVTFGDLHIFQTWELGDEPALLVGMDIIGVLDTLVIDYRRRELHIRPRRG